MLARGLQSGGVDGIGSYTRELGHELLRTENMEVLPVSFGFQTGNSFPLPNVVQLPRYLSMLARSGVGTLSFSGQHLLHQKVNLFHATDHLVPRYRDIPVVATLMDSIPLSNPDMVRTRFAWLKSRLWRHTGHWADKIITISDYSKSDIVHHFGIPPERIDVIPLGVDNRYFETIDIDLKASIRNKLNLPEHFFLFVGTLQPRKNLERLLDAHALLSKQLQQEIPLVIVGRAGWGYERLMPRLTDPSARGRIIWLNYLGDLEVRALMQSALAMVFVSLYEGFGLPVVEAFASGLPVIASNTTSIPEVTGDAALLVNPLDIGAISNAMKQLIDDTSLREHMKISGLQRAQKMSWAECAKQTFSVYTKLI